VPVQYQTLRLSAYFFPPVGNKGQSEVGQGYVPNEEIDKACNYMAEHGYRLVSTAVTGKLEMGRGRGDRLDLYLSFEREY
jgi:hypothetical protein